mmetsp:Transcript_25853/g.39114  ORF Transcript_25853/g.39114 Transcript_25853/m.39114 type:complete len:701 (-) Transcript_25853:5123-7225(-)
MHEPLSRLYQSMKSRPSLTERKLSQSNYRSCFLSSLGFIHLIAFWSYYVQFPALLSFSGIEPVSRIMPYVAPTMKNLLIERGFIDEDSLCELFAVLGMFLGAIIASGLSHHGALYILQTGLYWFLVRTGGTFYSFQWDILLIETTFVTSLTYAPWLSHRTRPNFSSLGFWPLRFLLFKLMLMSGVVKIQSGCPTWLNLTALEFHLATQCLPGLLAWYVHQLPPFLLRLAVAITLWIEWPAAVLLLSPETQSRRIGAMLQIILQVLIILTGNYNYFNLLTITLCLPVVEETAQARPDIQHPYLMQRNFICKTITWLCLFAAFSIMFSIERNNGKFNIRLGLTPDQVNGWTELILPSILNIVFGWATVQTVSRSISNRSIFTLMQGCISLFIILLVIMPLMTLTTSLESQGFWACQRIQPLYNNYIRPYGLTSSYGLFRRMTGVGVPTAGEEGWAGQPPSVVERPEIILECLYNDDEKWYELEFRWKPGRRIDRFPRQIAPHQPRLDWQMWFAALGRSDHNPWFIHFVKKLLDGCPEVMQLLDPSNFVAPNKSIRKIRAKLYYYDFTRIPSDWSKTVGAEKMLPYVQEKTFLPYLQPKTIWYRQFAFNYMPELEANSTSLANYLASHGFKNEFKNRDERCSGVQCIGWYLYSFVNLVRRGRLFLLAPFLFAFIMLLKFQRISSNHKGASAISKTDDSKKKTQ